jgi:hypothetical protein
MAKKKIKVIHHLDNKVHHLKVENSQLLKKEEVNKLYYSKQMDVQREMYK